MGNSIFKLKDGRDYDYVANDVESKSAILFHHGTPGDCTVWSSWVSGISTVRAIAASRPGYGLSSRRRGRNVASDIDNNSELLEHFGIEKFVSIGWSGGGPHALNMTRHPKNVGAITLAGVGEWGNDDLNFLAGMGPENHEEFGAALAGETEIENWMIKNSPAFKTVTGSDLISSFGGLIGDADKKALTPAVAEEDAAVFANSSNSSKVLISIEPSLSNNPCKISVVALASSRARWFGSVLVPKNCARVPNLQSLTSSFVNSCLAIVTVSNVLYFGHS